MESTPLSDQSDRPGPRWQISIRGLSALVLAMGLAAGVLRGSKDVWGEHLIQPRVSQTGATYPAVLTVPVPVERTIGAILEVAAVFLALLLVRDVAALARLRQAGGTGESARFLFLIAWRLAAIAALWWFVSLESSVLQTTYDSGYELNERQLGWGPNYRARERLYPICGMLIMLGLAMGMGAGSLFAGRPERFRRPWWLFAPLAALVAILLAATPDMSLIPYVVLIAMEAVLRAHLIEFASTPSLSARLLHAGIDVTIALTLLLSLALVVARDFERARRDEPWATSRRGRLARLLLLAVVAGSGARLAWVIVPRIQPWLAQGFGQVLEPSALRAIIAGFGLFASGLAARSLHREPAWEKPRWLTRLLACGRLAVLALLLFSVLSCLPSSGLLEPHVPAIITGYLDAIERGVSWLFWERLPDRLMSAVKSWLEPEHLIWALMVIGLALLLLELAVRPPRVGTAPFDGALASRDRALRISWLAAALVCLSVVALPSLFIAGQVIYHLQVNAADFARYGWLR